MDGGLYIAVFHLPRPLRRHAGAIGALSLPPGVYLYVGSAQRNLHARLRRHARRRKTVRWHIDHLSIRARMLGAILIDAPRSLECRVAAAMGRVLPPAWPRFGSSDCRCGGHLFRLRAAL